MKEILFGAAYYLEYMPYDRLKEDLDMMQQAGMNTIRIAESTWSTNLCDSIMARKEMS